MRKSFKHFNQRRKKVISTQFISLLFEQKLQKNKIKDKILTL